MNTKKLMPAALHFIMHLTTYGITMVSFTIIILNIQPINTKNITVPQINTMYVPVGQLHPQNDFAGVLINLNVAAAIKRGKFALQMTNTFLKYHKARQVIVVGQYSGEDRVINFMTIKRNKVKRNLQTLEADLKSVNKKFKKPKIPSTNITSKTKRSVHVDIKLDVYKCLTTIIDGIVSIFSSPKSLDKIEKSVKNLAFQTSRLESKFDNFADRIDTIMKAINTTMTYYLSTAHLITSINSALDIADETIMELLNSITPLVQGKLTHQLLDPLQAQKLIQQTQDMANKKDLQVIVNQPADILRCPVTTFATHTTWYALISLPMIDRSQTMQAYEFMNIPWFHNNISVQWDLKPGIIASDDSGLYPDIKNVFVTQTDMDNLCERYNNNYLCHKRINHQPTCQISLMNNRTEGCTMKKADDRVRYSFGPFHYLFFKQPTRTMIECDNKKPFSDEYYGLINMNDISQCKITTKSFTLLPKSTIASSASFADKINKVTLFTKDWLTMAIKFDKTINKLITRKPHPLDHLLNLTYPIEDHGIRIFGSHTVLIHSIGLFFIFTTLIMLLTICLMNFFNYIPEHFKPTLPTNDSSHSLAENSHHQLQPLNPFTSPEAVAPSGE